ERNRIAAIDTGVSLGSYTPLTIIDPGDGTPNKSLAQLNRLQVFSQDPATFGQDRFLLTNPPELRIQYTGYSAEIRSAWRRFMIDATFLAEKAIGPTNPGEAAVENDAGAIGALLMDPNTFAHASGRTYFDRGYVGKIRATFALPGRVELSAIGDYIDGQVFGRRILVTGLAQGPSVIAATVRGSPEGGN